MSDGTTPWDRFARSHPAWIVYPVLVALLAVQGGMGSGFNVPWFVFLTLTFAGHFVARGWNSTGWPLLGRSLVGLVMGLAACTLLLGVTFSIAYRCSIQC